VGTCGEDSRITHQAADGATGLLLVRPFLDIAKARLVATLQAAKVPFVEDPSNLDPRFARVRLRALLPQLAREGLDAERLALFARRLRRADAALEQATDRAAAELATASATSIHFDAAVWARLPAELRLRLLGRAITALGDEGPVELGKLEACESALDAALAARPTVRFRRTLAGAMVTLARGRLTVERAPPRRKRRIPRTAPLLDQNPFTKGR
jgi:tRNA(Ile)-lysidine synthase